MHKPPFNILHSTCTAFDKLIAARGRGLTATAYELYLELVAEARKAKAAVKMLKEEVASRLRVCKKTVVRACKQLVEAGLVAYTPGNGRGHASEYKIEGIGDVSSETVNTNEAVATPKIEEPKPQAPKKEPTKAQKPKGSKKEFVLPIGELAFIPTDDFYKAWEQFVAHRREKKRPIKTQRMIDMQFKGLKGFTEEEVITAIEKCISSGWTGIFPRKKSEYQFQNNDKLNGVPKHKTRVVNGKRQKIAGDTWATDGSEYDGLSQDEIWDKIMAS